MTAEELPDDGRPRWSAAEAARRCGVSRSTIGRYLAAGKLPGAVQTDDGWSIPLSALLAAGLTPDRPTPPDPAPDHARGEAEQVKAADQLAARVRELEAALAERDREIERERLQRATSDAVARERAEQIADLRRTVAALEAGRGTLSPVEPPAPTPSVPMQTPEQPQPQQRRGLFERLASRWGV